MDTQRASRLGLSSDAQAQISSSFAHFARKPRAGGPRTMSSENRPIFRGPEPMERRLIALP
jgi:hypothetical protein